MDPVHEQILATEATFFASDHKNGYDTRHDEPGIARAPRTRGPWRLSW